MKEIKISLDAMGGDYGPDVVVPSAIAALKEFDADLSLILVGNKDLLKAKLQQFGQTESDRLRIHHASEKVEMGDSPAVAMRAKKDSSMRVAINLVKDKTADACVSAGNTGALMAIARFVLKTLPGIDRPAIIYSLPVVTHHDTQKRVRMLDLGANVDCSSEHLFQFAVMGSVLAQGVDGIEAPKVGLLNIGSEAIKGSDVVKAAAKLISDANTLNYIGYVEGTDIFKGTADVIVCDGFVGNVALKASEGLAHMLKTVLKHEFTTGWYSKFAALVAYPVLKVLQRRFDPSQYNGASLLGLNGIVIKSHGNAKVKSFTQAIREARIEVEKNIIEKISVKLSQHLTQRTNA